MLWFLLNWRLPFTIELQRKQFQISIYRVSWELTHTWCKSGSKAESRCGTRLLLQVPNPKTKAASIPGVPAAQLCCSWQCSVPVDLSRNNGFSLRKTSWVPFLTLWEATAWGDCPLKGRTPWASTGCAEGIESPKINPLHFLWELPQETKVQNNCKVPIWASCPGTNTSTTPKGSEIPVQSHEVLL